MIVVVLGASGGTGRLAVDELLARGHQVRALVRDTQRFGAAPEGVTVVEGDVRDAASMRDAVAGTDAVLVTIGPGRGGGDKTPLFAPAARHLVEAMHAAGVTRVVAISAQGVGRESDKGLALPLRVFRALLGSAITDMRAMEDALIESELDYTIVRPGGLNDKPKGAYVVERGNALKGHGRTRRADLADAMARAVDEHLWSRQAVVVAEE